MTRLLQLRVVWAGLLLEFNGRNASRIRHASGLQYRVSRPSLLGETETLELLRPQDWQRRMGI